MKNLLVLFLVTAALLFLTGCEEDELTAMEVLEKSDQATIGSNSYSFEMETRQDMAIPGFGDMSTTMTATGKAIMEPMAAELQMKTDMAGMKMDMDLYIDGNMFYINIPELGWVKEDMSEEVMMAQAYEDPFAYFEMLQQVDLESLTLVLEEDFYYLTYEDETGQLAALMTQKVKEQLGSDFFDDPEIDDIFDNFDFSDLFYSITIDSETFLPAENTVSFKMTMEMMGEVIEMAQDVRINYLEFGTVEKIVIPDEVLDEAVPLGDMF